MAMVKFSILSACLLALPQATSFPISTTRHLLSGTFAQRMGCDGNKQKLVNRPDAIGNSGPDATREAECLAACEARGDGCCRINYDWTPARCHWVDDGSPSSSSNSDHWAAQVTAAPTAYTQGMGCDGSRQKLVNRPDAIGNSGPDATREAECLAACEARGYGCCRINYDWTPARCHWVDGGSPSSSSNSDHWAAQVTAAPTASPSPAPTPAPIPPSVVLFGTPVTLQAKSSSRTRTATGHVGDPLSLSDVGGYNTGFSPVFSSSSVKIGFSTDFSSGGYYFPSGYFRVDFDFDVCLAGASMTENNSDLIQSDLTFGADWVRIGLAGSLLKNSDTISIDFSFMVCTAAPTQAPTTPAPTQAPTTQAPTSSPTPSPTPSPSTAAPTTAAPTTAAPTTAAPTTAGPTPPPTTASPSLAPTPAPTPFSVVLGTKVTIEAKSSSATKCVTGQVGNLPSLSDVSGHNTGFSPVFYNSSVDIGFSTDFSNGKWYFISGYFRVDFYDVCLAGATLSGNNTDLTQSDFTYGTNWSRIRLGSVLLKNDDKIVIDFSFVSCVTV